MTKQYALKRISMLAVAMFIAAGLVTCTNKNKKRIVIIEEGLVAVNGQKIILTENSNKNEPLWLIAGDLSGEALGTVVTRSAAGDSATISGAAYVTPEGDGFSVTLGPDGYPRTISFADGSSMELKNYKDTTVEIILTSSTGQVVGPQTVALDDTFKELKSLIAENGLTFSTARSSAEKNQSGGLTASDYASDARTRKTVIKITSTALSVAGCAGALFISEVAPPVAVIACTSAYAGLVSTVEYLTDVKVFEGDDVSGGVSFILSAGACVGLSIPDCASTLLSIADAAIADCLPAKQQFVKRCYGGNVYWFNDCGVRSEPEEECACGCEGGVCKPVAACENLTIKVSAGADPSCIAKGETIYFASTVTGGNPASYVYAWDFGDGGSSALDSDAHTYASAGRKNVTLTVSDNLGNYGFAAIPVQVEDCEDFFEAGIGASADCAEKNKLVLFSAIARGGVAGSYAYQWNFGDGATGTEKTLTHSYSRDGLYLVSLIVEDSLGNRADNAVTVKVGSCPAGTTTTSITGSTTTTTADSGDEDDLITKCNAIDNITVSYDAPTYSDYGGGSCSLCSTKIRVNYIGPEDIKGVRMMYKQPTLQTYGPWLWKGMGPLPDIYEVALSVATGCCDGEGCTATSDISLIGAVYYDGECDDILEDPESFPLPLVNVDQPCRGYTR